MVGFCCTRSSVGVATITVAVALGLVNTPLDRQEISIETAVTEVQLRAVATQIAALASTEPGATLDAAATASATYETIEITDPIEGVPRQLLSLALLPVGLAIAPLWYLAAPISYSLYALATGNTSPGYGAIFVFLGWAAAPFQLSYLLVPTIKTPVTYEYTEPGQPSASSKPARAASAQNLIPEGLAPTDVMEADSAKSELLPQPRRSASRTAAVRPLAARGVSPAAALTADTSPRVADEPSLPDADVRSAARAAAATPRAASASRATKSDVHSGLR